ncbi:MAG: LacI family transcriptional regulator [Sphaerochaetaceae bacterium]|nr:LacI family transcriptional regulator [Sphaerochaetaceae bacterium]
MDTKNEKTYTLDAIAKELGVSKTTVSRAISGKGRIGFETRERILEFIKTNNYKPNVIARGLAEKKTYNIGLALPEELKAWDSPFCHRSINGICDVATANDYDLILLWINYNNITQLKRIVDNQKADGIILTRTMVKDDPVKYLKKAEMPFVVIGSSDDKSVTHIDNDHVQACKTLTELLLSRGLKKIALIGGETHLCVTNSRLKGFNLALEGKEKSVKSKVVLDAITQPQIIKATDEVLESKPDCIVCMDDYICSVVMTHLNERRISIPEDVSIATFYRSVMLEGFNPPITGLEFDEKALGGIACEKLIEKLKGKDVQDFLNSDYRLFMGKSIKQ